MSSALYQNDLLSIHHPAQPRDIGKHLFITSMDYCLGGRLHKIRPSIQFLYGHYLFKDEIKGFELLLKYISENLKLISYSEAVNRLQSGQIDDNYVCFSFDDGIKNCMRIAKYLHDIGVSAMFFLNPKVITRSGDSGFIQQHCRENLHLQPLDFMNWKDAETLLDMKHEIGNHTLSHYRLSDLERGACEEEIGLAKEELEKRVGEIKHFSWTYGKLSDITQDAMDIIRKTGHQSIASAIRGQHFESLDLNKNYILRDLVVFKDNLSSFRYFYNLANKQRLAL